MLQSINSDFSLFTAENKRSSGGSSRSCSEGGSDESSKSGVMDMRVWVASPESHQRSGVMPSSMSACSSMASSARRSQPDEDDRPRAKTMLSTSPSRRRETTDLREDMKVRRLQGVPLPPFQVTDYRLGARATENRRKASSPLERAAVPSMMKTNQRKEFELLNQFSMAHGLSLDEYSRVGPDRRARFADHELRHIPRLGQQLEEMRFDAVYARPDLSEISGRGSSSSSSASSSSSSDGGRQATTPTAPLPAFSHVWDQSPHSENEIVFEEEYDNAEEKKNDCCTPEQEGLEEDEDEVASYFVQAIEQGQIETSPNRRRFLKATKSPRRLVTGARNLVSQLRRSNRKTSEQQQTAKNDFSVGDSRDEDSRYKVEDENTSEEWEDDLLKLAEDEEMDENSKLSLYSYNKSDRSQGQHLPVVVRKMSASERRMRFLRGKMAEF